MKKFSLRYQTFSVFFLNTVLLFIVINLLAYLVPAPSKRKNDGCFISMQEMLKTRPELASEIYEGKSSSEISTLLEDIPNVKSHPVLEFMTTPVCSRFYNVGFENCRYNSFINDSNIRTHINNSTWLFGGSTTFGFGLPDDETIAYYLNQLDTANRYINFGVPSNNLRLELQKMILLLQKGYRPGRVIFFDGLNDLAHITRSSFEAAETPARPGNAFSNDFSIENLRPNANLLYALPVVRLYYEYKADRLIKNKLAGVDPAESVYNPEALYNSSPFLYYAIMRVNDVQPSEALLQKADTFYTQNLQLLDKLSKAYGFDYTVFYQPLGMLYQNSVFIRNKETFANELINYHAYKAIYKHMQPQVAAGKFAHFYDLSLLDTACKHPYIDLTHYSAPMNKVLAAAMLRQMAGNIH